MSGWSSGANQHGLKLKSRCGLRHDKAVVQTVLLTFKAKSDSQDRQDERQEIVARAIPMLIEKKTTDKNGSSLRIILF